MPDSRPATYEHIGEVRGLLLGVAAELMRRAHVHDKSKLVDPEKPTFDEVTPKLANLTYGSPEYKKALEEMGPALAHHYRENDHHPEHFENGPHDMGLIQMVEMICDWKAATRRHADGDIYESIRKNAERFGYGPEIERLLHLTARELDALELSPWPKRIPDPSMP